MAKSEKTELEPVSNHLPADISLAEQIKRDLEMVANQVEGTATGRIRMSGKGFTTPDGETGQTLRCVIVDFASANNFYPQAFDRDNPTPPTCFAVNKIPAALAPDDSVPEPQAESCGVCPKNLFESAANGKSKACKNTRLLAIMAENASDDSPIWLLSIPPSSIRMFDNYVAITLRGRHQTVPSCVLTEISMDPTKDFAAPRFKFERLLTEEELVFYYSRKTEAEASLLQKPRLLTSV